MEAGRCVPLRAQCGCVMWPKRSLRRGWIGHPTWDRMRLHQRVGAYGESSGIASVAVGSLCAGVPESPWSPW